MTVGVNTWELCSRYSKDSRFVFKLIQRWSGENPEMHNHRSQTLRRDATTPAKTRRNKHLPKLKLKVNIKLSKDNVNKLLSSCSYSCTWKQKWSFRLYCIKMKCLAIVFTVKFKRKTCRLIHSCIFNSTQRKYQAEQKISPVSLDDSVSELLIWLLFFKKNKKNCNNVKHSFFTILILRCQMTFNAKPKGVTNCPEYRFR